MSKIKDELFSIVETIDEIFGEGYAKKNPELIGRVFQARAQGQAVFASAELLYDAVYKLADSIIDIAQ